MGLPRLQFTVRRIMITVAVVALLVAPVGRRLGWSIGATLPLFRDASLQHREAAARRLGSDTGRDRSVQSPGRRTGEVAEVRLRAEELHLFVRDDRRLIRRAEVLRWMIDYHARMSGRFESAVWRPWRSVEQVEMPEWDVGDSYGDGLRE